MRTAYGQTIELSGTAEEFVFIPSNEGKYLSLVAMTDSGTATINMDGGLRQDYDSETQWVEVLTGTADGVGVTPSQIGDQINIVYPRYRIRISGSDGQKITYVAMVND